MRCVWQNKTRFVKTSDGGSILNDAINNLPFELHLPGHNFTGPSTRLVKRLNLDLTPKDWSKPINGVDNAAYCHDLCYAFNKKTNSRNQI
jgi:Phospholipase A2-like domain